MCIALQAVGRSAQNGNCRLLMRAKCTLWLCWHTSIIDSQQSARKLEQEMSLVHTEHTPDGQEELTRHPGSVPGLMDLI